MEKEAGVPFSEQKSIFITTGNLMTEVYFLSPRLSSVQSGVYVIPGGGTSL